MNVWTLAEMPDLQGKRFVVTGGGGGLGSATCRALVQRGAHVIVADVYAPAGLALADGLGAAAEYRQLNLADLHAIKDFADTLCADEQPIDGLINIAGIYPPAERGETRNGLERTMAINHLGHFALTGQLLPALLRSPAPRVVSISSITQAWGRIAFDELQSEQRYLPYRIYAMSKLASLMFGLELHQWARRHSGCPLASLVAHPGIARTAIGQERKRERRGLRDVLEDTAQAFLMRWFGQSAAEGALPILYAATAKQAVSGGFYGPDGFGQFAGHPIRVRPSKRALDAPQRRQLWQASEMLTRVRYTLD